MVSKYDHENANDPLTIALFEKALSEMLAGCGLTAYGAVQAMAISLARVLYGMQQLHGEKGANEAADLFDMVLEKALVKMMEEGPKTKTPNHPGSIVIN